MNYLKSFFYLFALTFVLNGCELNADADGDNTDDLSEENNGEPKLEAKLSYGGKDFSFTLRGDQLTNKVVFMTSRVNFKATNEKQQVLNIELAGTDLYESSSGVFRALPNLPYESEENLASVSFYDPTEQPLTNVATKYLIDDEVVVSKLSEKSIILAYEGDAITGEQLTNTDNGHFSFSLELNYSNFEIQDLR